MDKCPYEVLDLQKDCTIVEIKKAYRKMALRYHPDRVEISLKEAYKEKFCKITMAYGILSDKRKRKIYDEYGIIDDGQTEIILDDSTDVLTGILNTLKEKKNCKDEEKEQVPEKSLGRKWREFWLGERNTIWTQCIVCKGKGETKKEVGFFIIDEMCKNCKGVGKVEMDIPIQPYNNSHNGYYGKNNGYFGNYYGNNNNDCENHGGE